jgi:hypothetical protein
MKGALYNIRIGGFCVQGELQRDASPIDSQVHVAKNDFRTLVHANRLRVADLPEFWRYGRGRAIMSPNPGGLLPAERFDALW